jgi:endonuclease-3 related protein
MFKRLFGYYGPQHWWPAETPVEVIIGAILTQCATWSNVQKALSNLRKANVLAVNRLKELPESELAALIFPSGYYNSKARKIKSFVHVLFSKYQGRLETMLDQDTVTLRRELLEVYGIGPETVDSIILYAAGRPVFVVDAYTKRILERVGTIRGNAKYEDLQQLFMSELSLDTKLFQEYHALIVKHAKTLCKTKPECRECPLIDLCETGRERLGAVELTESQEGGAQ